MPALHATELLMAKNPPDAVAMVALFGAERFLKLEALQRIPGCSGEDADLNLIRLPGSSVSLRDVSAELRTMSMFGDRRVILVESADEFVSANRDGLERLLTSPLKNATLILDVLTFPKTTRLCKLIAAEGLVVECTPLKGAARVQWLQRVAREEFGKSLKRDAADLMLQLAGDSPGLLMQEVAKVSSLVGDVDEITADDVSRVVGGWRLETTWEMLDAVRDGNVGHAIEALDKLLIAGEAPMKLLGGIVYSFRKLAEATEIARQTRDLTAALTEAGVFPAAIGASDRYLRRIGFDRASRIMQLLMEADHDMKGGSRVEPRLQLERLFVQLGGRDQAPRSASGSK